MCVCGVLPYAGTLVHCDIHKYLLDCFDAVYKDVRVRFVVEHDSNRDVTRHFFLKALTIDQADSDVMTKVNIIAEDMSVDKLPDVLAPVIGL